MKKIKDKKVLIGAIVCILFVCGIGGYFIYDNNRKNEIKDKMNIIFTDTKEVEYGTKDYDVKKELVKNVENAEIKDFSKLDTLKIGEQTLTFTLVKSDVEKTVEHKIKVVDTKGPEITLEADSKELTIGDEYDFMSNIKSIKDVVDGDIKLNKDASDINKKANEEYKKLKKEDISDETKVADKKLNEFFIETITENEESDKESTTTLYLKNCYYVDGSVDTSKEGEYKINVVAVDKNGVKTTKEFTVTVKEKEPESEGVSNGGGNGSYASAEGSYSNGGYSTSGVRGSIQDVINTASAQAGKSYVAGGRGPDSFDCDGLIIYSFNVNGYNIGSPWSAGYSIGTDLSQAQPGDIILTPNHSRLYLGGNSSAQAMNPSQGIRAGFDSQIMSYLMWKGGDPNFSSDPLQILDIRRVR